jgi:hypothetical protein
MSYDFALQKICSHEIRRETGTYDGISGMVRFRAPPVNQKVTLWVDGVEIPPSGLVSYASVAFLNPGPYRIKRDLNDLIYVKIGKDLPTFVQLITGNVKAQDLAEDLSRKIPLLAFSVMNNRVVVQSKNPINGAAFSFVDPRWTDKTQSLPTTGRTLGAYSRLGIAPGRVVSGKVLFPPWTIEKFSEFLPLEKVIKFHGVVPNKKPTIHLSYVTYANFCRRCGGTRIEFDYSVKNGSYETVRDTDLLSQELDKFLFTRLGSHWKWPWLGSKLIDRIGGKGSTAKNTVNSMLTMDASQAFAAYQNIKMQQNQNPNQQVTDAEYPMSIKSIGVSVLPNDPTVALINITIACRSRVLVPLKRIIGNPNPYTLGGSESSFLLRG